MAINIKFDLVGNPEPPTINLATRNGKKLGLLEVNQDSIDLSDKLVDASEFSFTLNKPIKDNFNLEDEKEKKKYEFLVGLWDKVIDFKLVYCKEWDKYFEIKVELDEDTETVKTVFCTELGKAELSQIMLYNVEINTEDDIARDDYKVTNLYNSEDTDASCLHRMIKDKAPHYNIAYVDPTIAKIQRMFSFDDSSIEDSFQEIAEEIGCLFDYPSNSDINGKIKRDIFVYDLQQNCNDCGYRGEFIDKCPKCGSTNIKYGYGKDTSIFVTSDELASGGINLTTDTDSVKNCFKLETGDDLMTATVRNCNPNGTDYIWRFSNDTKEDMSDELVDRIDSYDVLYKSYYNDYESNVDTDLLSSYNTIVNKYSSYNEDLQSITTPIKGYSNLMNAYYNVIDLALYLKSGLMPTIVTSDTNAEEQARLLTTSSISPVAVTNANIVSLATANSAVLAMAKIVVKSTYKVQVNTSELIEDGDAKYWIGNFIVTNYSDEEDTIISSNITVEVNDDLESFIRQKIDKALNKENTDDLSITGLFEKEYDDFCAELKKYALNPLTSFHDACQACIDILIEQGVGSGDTWGSTESGTESNLYENLYEPYYNKLAAIESEMKVREDEINIISGIYDTDGNLLEDGLKTEIENCKNQIQNVLNFEKYLGTNLWLEFCSYRREDKYSNDNYISDGLNNAELFKKAFEFFEVAENEIYKASELQHSISTTLKNLLAIQKFKPLVEHFNVGNWIRIQVDDKIYKLRLVEYGIDFGSFEDISVEFSDVTKIKNGITDVKNTLSKASSMASSYSSVKRQASQGEKGNAIVSNWIENGLDATNTKIVGTENQNQVWDKNGILCREYDPITETYSPEQLKIINSTLAITDNNWENTKTAIGKIYYVDPKTGEQKCTYGVNAETIIGKLILGEAISLNNDDGTLSFDENGLVVKNGNKIVTISPQNEEVINISNGDESVFVVDENGELTINGNIMARSLSLSSGVTIDSGVITDLAVVAISGNYSDLSNKPNLSTVATSGSYNDLSNKPTRLSDFTNDASFITKDVDNLSNYYNKNNINNLLSSKVNTDNLSTVATSGSYNDLVDIDELKNWVLEQIQMSIN